MWRLIIFCGVGNADQRLRPRAEGGICTEAKVIAKAKEDPCLGKRGKWEVSCLREQYMRVGVHDVIVVIWINYRNTVNGAP